MDGAERVLCQWFVSAEIAVTFRRTAKTQKNLVNALCWLLALMRRIRGRLPFAVQYLGKTMVIRSIEEVETGIF